MSRVYLDVLSIDAAELGPENPLPPLAATADVNPNVEAGDADEEMRRNMAYGRMPTMLPYLTQDGYGRERAACELRTAVVENEVLRAEFLLDFGGRLWSLLHKPSGRELLYRNKALQPGNLALRNAWFAGGVEWNIGTRGHSPTTCEPLHAVMAQRPDGTPVLRMYEFERTRQLVFQIDAYLPEGSPVLLVHVRVLNPNDAEVPVYWWSNIAVPEAEDMRVVAPADRAWHYAYDRTVRAVPVPEHRGLDYSYTARCASAADYFYDIPNGERPWIAAVDGSGRGLVQTSTDRLRGRKLFLWGTAPGSAHWQDWLSPDGGRYVEIQAGLARTQLEHLPIPAKGQWSWIEAYGLFEADPEQIHGEDWEAARTAASASIEKLLPRAVLDAELAGAASWIDAEPVATLHRGSGWGALERRLRSSQGNSSLTLPGLPFGDETLSEVQAPWLHLMETGRMPAADPANPPAAYQVHAQWLALVEQAGDWLGLLHLGVARVHAGDPEAARVAWSRSIESKPTAWAYRSLAALDMQTGRLGAALDHYRSALALAPDCLPLAVEAVQAMVRADEPLMALDTIDALPPAYRQNGRVHLAEARARLDVGDLARVGRLLETGISIADIREGEESLGDLWFAYQERRIAAAEGIPVDAALRERVVREFPVPEVYDFRMTASCLGSPP
ncbi:DUF5107 domain-containing protein [Streptomyces tubercidicus]